MQQALALASQALDRRRKAAEVLENLSPRERDIAADVANGLSNKEIAAIRNIARANCKNPPDSYLCESRRGQQGDPRFAREVCQLSETT